MPLAHPRYRCSDGAHQVHGSLALSNECLRNGLLSLTKKVQRECVKGRAHAADEEEVEWIALEISFVLSAHLLARTFYFRGARG